MRGRLRARAARATTCSSELQREQRHADRHQRIGNPERRRPGRASGKLVDPGLVQQRPGFPGEEGAEREARDVDDDLRGCDSTRGGRSADDRLDADMAALRLHAARRQEDRADEQEDRRSRPASRSRSSRNSATTTL